MHPSHRAHTLQVYYLGVYSFNLRLRLAMFEWTVDTGRGAGSNWRRLVGMVYPVYPVMRLQDDVKVSKT